MTTGVTAPRGFVAAGITAGLKPSNRPDLALLLGGPRTTSYGLFTTNAVAAAPVRRSKALVHAGRGRGVLVNSGQANAATGPRGDHDVLVTTGATAASLGLETDDLLACSTGVIGEPIHLEPFLAAVPALVGALSPDGGAAFATAIMTTDTVTKEAAVGAGPFVVGGAAKGVGMVSPNLATMLAFVTTDAAVPVSALKLLALTEVAPRFNALTVDGCTSTNDTVLLFASGEADGAQVAAPGTAGWDALRDGVVAVTESLLSQLIHDAEGVRHVVLIDVEGARDAVAARTIAKAVADSPLVKTAVFGEDPNPGRILQAVGASGVVVADGCVDVWIGDVQVVQGGVIPSAYFEEPALHAAAKAAMADREVGVRVRVGDGLGRSRVLGSDLSYDYVRINGEYTT